MAYGDEYTMKHPALAGPSEFNLQSCSQSAFEGNELLAPEAGRYGAPSAHIPGPGFCGEWNRDIKGETFDLHKPTRLKILKRLAVNAYAPRMAPI